MGRILDDDLCSCSKKKVKCDKCDGKKTIVEDG